MSTTLSNIAINPQVKDIPTTVEGVIYVDNFTLLHASSLEDPIVNFQTEINLANMIAKDRGFGFSSSKTTCIYLCRLRSEHPEPGLTINGKDLTTTDTTKILGVVFDRKLNWKQHTDQLIVRCHKIINIMKYLYGPRGTY